jgi:hypothetical protein
MNTDAIESLTDSYFAALPWITAFTLLIYLVGPSIAILFKDLEQRNERRPLDCDPGLDRISKALGRYRGSQFHGKGTYAEKRSRR